MNKTAKRPVALVVLDGWGINPDCDNNAVCQAKTPRLDELARACPTTILKTSGESVGLPEGQMGNSEIGHLNLGAGRIIFHGLFRINKAIENGDFFANGPLCEAMHHIKQAGGKLHLMGLVSNGGIHSHQEHLHALIDMAKQVGLDEILIHAFTDGRDTPPDSGAGFLEVLENKLSEVGVGRVATVMGRYYAMDRDNRWERTERAWRAIVLGEGKQVASSKEAMATAYGEEQTDEFVEPRVIQTGEKTYEGVEDGDGMIFFNFRSDRARQLTRSLTQKDFSGFSRPRLPDLSAFVCMMEYDKTFALPVAFQPEEHHKILGEVIADAGLTQLRIAETEKYAHVTFFFNGGVEKAFTGEDRILIPSPQEVPTYDHKPEMSAPEVTDEVVRRIESRKYDLIILNYANPDMVGHTGVLAAAITAMETVDHCVGRVAEAIRAAGGCALITADHGNCEQMTNGEGSPHTAHTTNIVPLILVEPPAEGMTLKPGILADVAPTLLELIGLPSPPEMTGQSLLIHKSAAD
ncbi:MAG TPA: 2,3-bisphosphoglycerate-independent phosphoglycerate mutase [Desulfuromonadales bacterium]|nr:2,3-bisphosphoglycerate-independent phosphoglycerate mutase [Desulfuromonadales bacterium]